MQPNSQLVLYPAPAKVSYGGLEAYIQAIALYQSENSTGDTCVYLTQECKARATDLIQAQPFLVIAACLYVNAIVSTQDSYYTDIRTIPLYTKLEPLLNIILEVCGTPEGDFSFFEGWSGLDDAINAVYNHHNPSHQPPHSSSSSTPPKYSNGHDDNV